MKRILYLFAFVILSACAQTTITDGDSFVDPGWNGSPAASMIVQVNNSPLGEQTAIEKGIVQSLNEQGIKAIASHTLFLPTRDYSTKERQSAIVKSGYETILQITPYDREVIKERTSPPSGPFGTFGVGGGNHTHVGVGVGFNFGRETYREEPIINYKTDLYLIDGNKKLWTSDYSTRGATGMSFEQVGKLFANEIVEKLDQDGLI